MDGCVQRHWLAMKAVLIINRNIVSGPVRQKRPIETLSSRELCALWLGGTSS